MQVLLVGLREFPFKECIFWVGKTIDRSFSGGCMVGSIQKDD